MSVSDRELMLLKAVDGWRVTAAEEVDSIGGWRDADPNDRWHRYWSDYPLDQHAIPRTTMPHGFWVDTTLLVSAVVERYPKLDPTPLQEVYSAVAAWHEDKCADRIPPQPVLFATLERAMTVVGALETNLLRSESAPIEAQTADAGAPANEAAQPVILQGRGEAVNVLGIEKPKLTKSRYDVVETLIEAGPEGLTKDELDRKSKHTDARKILKRLAESDPDWAKVIGMAGKPDGRYRIRQPAH